MERIEKDLKIDSKRFILIFVDRRFVAKHLCELLQNLKNPIIKAEFLVGYQHLKKATSKNDRNFQLDEVLSWSGHLDYIMNEKKKESFDFQGRAASNIDLEEMYARAEKLNQKRVIESIRNGDVNVVVATSVAEEGFDIQACDLVFSYDNVDTLTNYIQHFGRARKEKSQYLLMSSNKNVKKDRIK